ncbi:hypothetical protein [Rubrolithibacter danxiaensis]|uniref:hypothetical protein n=1 Tax=Rubrolithibacter danxiaensis TaxID=3390805 RepID=UPI003BF7A875
MKMNTSPDIIHKGDKILPSLCETKINVLQNVQGPSIKIELKESSVHGYGVFAKETIEVGELIEEARLLALKFRSKYTHDPVLRDYIWADKSCSCDKCRQHGLRQYIALGLRMT